MLIFQGVLENSLTSLLPIPMFGIHTPTQIKIKLVNNPRIIQNIKNICICIYAIRCMYRTCVTRVRLYTFTSFEIWYNDILNAHANLHGLIGPQPWHQWQNAVESAWRLSLSGDELQNAKGIIPAGERLSADGTSCISPRFWQVGLL